MNYLFLNNGFFFKYVKLENVNFKLYNSRSKDDLEFFIDEIKEKSISLRIKYLIYDKETSKSLSNGIKIKRLKEVIKNVNVKLNELSQINYSYLDFDFKNGFINKESKIIISLVDENCINLEKINEFGLEYVGGVIGNIKNGLDINSSYMIYDILNEEKAKNTAILFIGEDLDVLMTFCDKIMVLCHGKNMGIIHTKNTNKEEIGLMMTGALDLTQVKKEEKYGIAEDSRLSEDEWKKLREEDQKNEDREQS